LSGTTTIATTTVTSNNAIFGPFTQTGSLKLKVTVTNTRSQSITNDSTSCTCYAYSKPTLSNFTAYRVDENGNATDKGTRLKYSFKTNYSSVNNTNAIKSINIGYKEASSSDPYNLVSVNATNGTISNITFDASKTYLIQAEIFDNYWGTDTRTITLSNSSRIFNVLSNGTGVAFGKMAEDNDKLDSKWLIHARNGVTNDSDRNLKTNIKNMSKTQEQLFSKLQPVTFQFIDGSSGRTHYGFISQDVEDSLYELGLTSKDFAGFCKDRCKTYSGAPMFDDNGNEVYNYSLRYSEFIALNTFMIQKLQAENAELRLELQELKEMIVGTSSKNIE
jgi:hypothetical protein